jgi:hypothetical protein
MPRPSTTKKTVKRTPAGSERLGFEDPIPMQAHHAGALGVVGMIHIYNRFAAEMREYNSVCDPATESEPRTDIAYFNY